MSPIINKHRSRSLEILALYAVIMSNVRGVAWGFTAVPSPRIMMLVSSNNALFLAQRSTVNNNKENTKQLNEIEEEFNDSFDEIVSNNRPKRTEKETTSKTKKKKSRIPILSYQSNYVIVSKPAGMTMHRNANAWGQAKTIPVLESTIHKQVARKPYLVHRLDHRTSGACLLGFTSEAASILHGRLRSMDATKLYVSLVRGDLRDKFQRAATANTSIDMSVDGNGSIIGSRGSVFDVMPMVTSKVLNKEDDYNGKITVNLPIKVNIDDNEIEKDATTDFYFLSSMTAVDENDDNNANQVINYYDNDDGSIYVKTKADTKNNIPWINKSLTLLLCHPRTGRTHQIRRHVQKAFHAPIIGDVEHGDSRVNRYWRESIGLDRLGLHCWYLRLPQPPTLSSPTSSPLLTSIVNDDNDFKSNIIQCVAPLTVDFANALHHDRLKMMWSEACRIEPRLGMGPYDDRGGTFGRNFRNRKG